jgi:hypothetical protein
LSAIVVVVWTADRPRGWFALPPTPTLPTLPPRRCAGLALLLLLLLLLLAPPRAGGWSAREG